MGITLDIDQTNNNKPTSSSLDSYITRDVSLLGSKPHIAGRRIAVAHIAQWHLTQQRSLGDIAYDFDLPLPAVYAAIAYYLSHKDEIDQQEREEQEWVEEFKTLHPDMINPLQRKLAQKSA